MVPLQHFVSDKAGFPRLVCHLTDLRSTGSYALTAAQQAGTVHCTSQNDLIRLRMRIVEPSLAPPRNLRACLKQIVLQV